MKKKWIAIASAAIIVMAITGCGANEGSKSSRETAKQTETMEQSKETIQSSQSTSSGLDGGGITEEEAKQIALMDANVAEADLKNIYVHLGNDNGRQEYEIEFFAGNLEYDYDIDASNGIILSKDTDTEYVDGNQILEGTGNQAVISEADAKKTALAKVEGATDADIRIHLETDDRIQQYSGSIIYKEKKYEFSIDAVSGAVIEWEEDSIYDD